jgi:hypothetical protein
VANRFRLITQFSPQEKKALVSFQESTGKWQICLKSFLLNRKVPNYTLDVNDTNNEQGYTHKH